MSPEKLDLHKHFYEINAIDPELFVRFDVKRGLRNSDGTGVMAGLTNIANVHGYIIVDGEKCPDEGRLFYRGHDIEELTDASDTTKRWNFEEVAYLLLMGKMPDKEELELLVSHIDAKRELPNGFTASLIMKDASPDLMNCLARSVLLLYSTDEKAEDRSPEHEINIALSLISRLPRIMVLGYYAMMAQYKGDSMIMHRFIPGQSTAETILSMLRKDREFTADEARMLDIMLTLHAEHGGGNNSTFTLRTLTSSDTDPYSAYSGAIGSLKGLRHGGANGKVQEMRYDIKANVKNWTNEGEVADYLEKMVRKEAFDKTGLIYGMGHAVYTLSDPRTKILREYAARLAAGTEYEAELQLLETVEKLAPEVFNKVKGSNKALCANVDMYSGFVYSMLQIPEELFTPLFACARMVGWAAHRFEEIVSGKRIIRPAYKSAMLEEQILPGLHLPHIDPDTLAAN
ncbi:MAG: citrate synthase [Coriobacteriia bacterium]|nr:citrate synthase [Coriobacteriia bacterium]MCL2750425.1 citrate synthase [Coriobacteriia bacterium]